MLFSFGMGRRRTTLLVLLLADCRPGNRNFVMGHEKELCHLGSNFSTKLHSEQQQISFRPHSIRADMTTLDFRRLVAFPNLSLLSWKSNCSSSGKLATEYIVRSNFAITRVFFLSSSTLFKIFLGLVYLSPKLSQECIVQKFNLCDMHNGG